MYLVTSKNFEQNINVVFYDKMKKQNKSRFA